MSKNKKIILSNDLIKNSSNNSYSKKQFFAIPVIPIKVALKYNTIPGFNHFERAILSLLLSKKSYTVEELSNMLMLDSELVELIINTLIENKDLDKNRQVTSQAEDKLKGIYNETTVVVRYAFYDLNRKKLLSETADPNSIIFKDFYANGEQDNGSETNLLGNNIVIKSDSNDYKLNFSIVDIKNNSNIDVSLIEKGLNRESLERKEIDEKILISANIIEILKQKYYLLSYVETYINSANTNRWSVKNPVTLESDLDLQNFFYYNNANNKVITHIIESLMKNRIEIVNDNIDRKKLYNFIREELFNKEIDKKHIQFIEPLVYVLDGMNLKNIDVAGQSAMLQVKDSLKMAMIYFGQLYENLLYQAAIEYAGDKIEVLIDNLSNSKEKNREMLTEMAKIVGFDVGDDRLSVFNTSKFDLLQMFVQGKDYVLNACATMNVLIGNYDEKFYINEFANQNKDFLVKIDKLKTIRDNQRHTTDLSQMITIKDYLMTAFDIMYFAFGYKVNQQKLDEIFASKVSLYDYSYSHEYVRSRIGTVFFESKNEKIIAINNHLIEVHKKILEQQSDYIASAHSILEDIYKEILNTIIDKNKIMTDFNLKDYFNTAYDFENYIKELGFDIEIDQELFKTELNKSLVVDSLKTEGMIKNGFNTRFEKSTNRIKMQSLILLFKMNSNFANCFLFNEYDLKKLFKLTSIIMFLDMRHQQKHIYSKKQAQYVLDELLSLIRNIYNNKEIIDWRIK